MSDVRLAWASTAGDVVIVANDLAVDDGLETAVVLSLFTDRRATATDVPPDGTDNRRGWWGDALADIDGDLIGSRLWLLSREKQLPTVLDRAKAYALEALEWMLVDGVAKSVNVIAEFTKPGWLGLQVQITKPNGDISSFQYGDVWTGQAAAGGR